MLDVIFATLLTGSPSLAALYSLHDITATCWGLFTLVNIISSRRNPCSWHTGLFTRHACGDISIFSFSSLSRRLPVVVNVSRSQLLFNSLVSVSVQKDELIHQLLQDRLTVHPLCHEVKAADGPSLSVFVTSDLVRQKPLPPSEEPPCDKLKPLTRRACSTFDLSQRQRRWEATPWLSDQSQLTVIGHWVFTVCWLTLN